VLDDFIHQLSATPDRVRRIVDGIGDEDLSRRPAEGGFSLRENVLHLRDVDVDAFSQRIVRILGEDRPFLADFPGAQVARERNYNQQPVGPALDAFARSRADSMLRLRGADLERTADLEDVGSITLRQLLQRWVDHDAEHIAEMMALVSVKS
jgi:DinB family protein